MVKLGETIESDKVDEIYHFISEEGVVLLSTNQHKRSAIDYNLDQIETMVDPNLFFRINRKVIIHLNSIQKVGSYFNSRLKIHPDKMEEDACIVSRDRVNNFKRWLVGN